MKTIIKTNMNLLPACFTTALMLLFLGVAFAQEDGKKGSEAKQTTNIKYSEKNGETTLVITEVVDGKANVKTFKGEEAKNKMNELNAVPRAVKSNSFIYKSEGKNDIDIIAGDEGQTVILLENDEIEINTLENGVVELKCQKDSSQSNCIKTHCFKLSGDSVYKYNVNGEQIMIGTFQGNWDNVDSKGANNDGFITDFDFSEDLDQSSMKFYFDTQSNHKAKKLEEVEVVHSIEEAIEILEKMNIEIDVNDLKEEAVQSILVQKKILIEELPQNDEKLTLDVFRVYPNPSNGSLTIAITPNTTGKVEISVTDESGKTYLKDSYDGRGSYLKDIQVDSKNSKILFVQVLQGKEKVVKKVIVQ